MLKRGRPCIVHHDGCERATGDLSSSTTRSSGQQADPRTLPQGQRPAGSPKQGVSGKAAKRLGHPPRCRPCRGSAPGETGRGGAPGAGAAALRSGDPLPPGEQGKDRAIHLAASGASCPASWCNPPAPAGPPGSSLRTDSTWGRGVGVRGEGDTGHWQSPCTHVPWRGPASESQVVLKTGHLCYIRH